MLPDLDFGKRAPGTVIPKVNLTDKIQNLVKGLQTLEILSCQIINT